MSSLLRRAIRHALLDPLLRRANYRLLERSVRALRASLDPGLVEPLRHAWGNEAYSADAAYVAEVIARVARCSAPVLECGCGVTTLAAAVAGERRGVTIWSLEQDKEWLDYTARRLSRNRVRNVQLRFAPLKDYGGFVWYDVGGLDLPRHFELVLCDGPAVFEVWGSAHAQWRYGLLPVLGEKHIRLDDVLLDDATEPRAANLLLRWRQEFGMDHRMIRSTHGDCAIVSRAL